SEGGYIVCGRGNNLGSVIKTDATGSVLWQKSYGATVLHSVQEISDGYILAGTSYNNDSFVHGHHGTNNDDFWVAKINLSGDNLWEKSLGGSGYEGAESIQQTFDGGFIVAGFSSSSDGDVHKTANGINNYWVVRLNSNGDTLWERSFGGSHSDGAKSV